MGWLANFFARPDPVAHVPQPAMTRGPRLDRVLVHVTWATPQEISKLAPGELAFTRGPELLADGEYHTWITAPMPRDFNDLPRLQTLGHELFHGVGAEHEEVLA